MFLGVGDIVGVIVVNGFKPFTTEFCFVVDTPAIFGFGVMEYEIIPAIIREITTMK